MVFKIQKFFHYTKPSLSTQHSVFHLLFNIKLPHARISPSHDSPPYPQRNTQDIGNSVSGHVPESVVGNRLTPTKQPWKSVWHCYPVIEMSSIMLCPKAAEDLPILILPAPLPRSPPKTKCGRLHWIRAKKVKPSGIPGAPGIGELQRIFPRRQRGNGSSVHMLY